jgi:hypothetical protein
VPLQRRQVLLGELLKYSQAGGRSEGGREVQCSQQDRLALVLAQGEVDTPIPETAKHPVRPISIWQRKVCRRYRRWEVQVFPGPDRSLP